MCADGRNAQCPSSGSSGCRGLPPYRALDDLYDWTHWHFLERHSGMLLLLSMSLAYVGQRLKLYKAGNDVVLPVETLFTLAKQHDLEEEE